MHKIKEKLMDALYEYEEKLEKMGNASISTQDLEKIHKLTDTVKNICKIYMLDEEGMDDEMSYAGGGYSYARGGRGRGSNARRDSMGRYSREGGYSEEGGYSREGGYSYARGGGGRGGNQGGGGMRGGSSRMAYSRDGAKEYMIERIEEMMQEAQEPKEKEALRRCMMALEEA